ncbi:MAG TPA: phenylalanine--tRNA ligase subunit beta [Blastocatellia bacterium]|nr:phenylalanine--tRNA ligase subunit beta [Blastocatellia bacterium]
MKVSYNWLKELIDINLAPRDLAARLTMAGHAVDAVEGHGDDFVLEIDLTSNRPDCLSHLGIAREVATILDQPLRPPEIKLQESATPVSDVTSVVVEAPTLCPRYTARVIRGVKVGPSPEWLVKRLEALGQRSVNNVADITNYVMLELGQPLHAFDFDKLGEQRIVVRRARANETITLLDGEEKQLTSDMLVIADANEPVAMGGIKGGLDSGISDTTTNVLLEAAYFNPASIRQTSKSLGVSTEASYRFERGADYEMSVLASNRATALIAELCGGEVLAGIIDVHTAPAPPEPIQLRLTRYHDKTGLEVELGEAARILTTLGLRVETATDSLRATPPSWRHDLSMEEDLIEEVARIIGYDKLPTTLPGSAGAGAYLPGETERRAVRQSLTALGYHEAINFSFVNAETDAQLTLVPAPNRLRLSNPIDATQAEMRTTLLGGLLDSLQRNLHHGTRNVKLFEFGKCFVRGDEERPLEQENLALVATGVRNETDWQAAAARLDFYDFKGAVETVIFSLNLPNLIFAPIRDVPYLHPGRAAVISLGNEMVGHVGQLHPQVAARYKFKQPVFIAEINFGALLQTEAREARYQPLPKFPTVSRDIAVLIDRSVSWAEIAGTIQSLSLPQLENLRLFDLYVGPELPAGKHSLALSLRLRAADRTLTEAEINELYERVVMTLQAQFGAELR